MIELLGFIIGAFILFPALKKAQTPPPEPAKVECPAGYTCEKGSPNEKQ